jgi:hypothetical protein
MNATEKRTTAISMIMERYVSADGTRLIEDTIANRTELTACILMLLTAGRTDRWRAAVKCWAGMVANVDNELDWAMLQGQVFVMYAV